MSSATPPTPVDSGDCVVCGQVTTTRCSSCANHGTGWMYFCSREHQKLIWFAHKRVCGVNSNHFRWPFLSNAEKAAMLELGQIEVILNDGRVHCWETECQKRGSTLETLFDVLSEDSDDPIQMIESCIPQLVKFRSHGFRLKVLSSVQQIPVIGSDSRLRVTLGDLFGEDPFGALAVSLDEGWSDLAWLKGKFGWWSELHHRLLIFVSINCQHFKKGTCLPPDNTLFVHSRKAIAVLLEEEASKTHPEEAIKLSKELDRCYIHDTPSYFGSGVETSDERLMWWSR